MMKPDTEKLLYDTLKRLLAGEEVALESLDVDGWLDTVTELARTPPEKRHQVFQSLDTIHQGALNRLLRDYQEGEPEPELPPPEDFSEDACPPLPAHLQPDPTLAAVGSPWLNRYIDFSRYWSPRSYDGYHEACGLWLLSTIAARRVAFKHIGPHYTNLAILLAGMTTLTAKSTAAEMAILVLEQADLDWLRLHGKATPQALISRLAGKTPKDFDKLDKAEQTRVKQRFGFAGQRGWFYDEFGGTLAKMTRPEGYMSDFNDLLREFDRSPTLYANDTLSRGDEKVERPYLTILANLTPEDLRSVAGRGAHIWRTGFLSRFAFVTPPANEISVARAPLDDLFVPDDLVKPLRAWHRRLGLPIVSATGEQDGGFLAGPTCLRVTAPPPTTYYPIDEVADAMYEYNEALIYLALELNKDFVGSYGRLHEKALRVAALLASVEGDEAIRLKHWARAQAVVERWRVSLHRCYEQINEHDVSVEATLEQRIIRVIKRDGPQTAAAIARSIRNYSSPQIKRVADDMVETGVLRLLAATGRQVKPRYALPLDDQGDSS